MRTKTNPYIKDVNYYTLDTSNYDTTVSINEPKYEPSLVGQCAVSKYSDGVKFHSDIHLLLHDKNIVDKLGVDTIRDYLKNATGDTEGTYDSSNFSDSELFQLINDRRFNTLTDKYELQQALASDFNHYKDKVDYDVAVSEFTKQIREGHVNDIKESQSKDVNGGSIQSNNV